MNPLFKDKRLDEKYKVDGIVVVPFADKEQLNELKKLFQNLSEKANSTDGFYYSLLTNNLAGNMRIRNEIKQILEPGYQRIFINYHSFSESFLAKQPASGEMLLHQDWSYVDEDKHGIATVWCPLMNITAGNGALFAIKGSHRFFKTYRSGSLPTSRIQTDGNLQKHISVIEVNEGSAAIFHPALFHGSFPNKSNKLRVIACALVKEDCASLTYYHKKNELVAEAYFVSEKMLLEEIGALAAGERPQKGVSVKTIQREILHVSSEDLMEKISAREATALT